MIVFLNGQFVPETEARVSVFDRSFQYGDGLFETIRISNSRPFRWAQHLERLKRGARFLQIEIPFSTQQLQEAVTELVRLNGAPEAMLRITLSRGVGVRGYSTKGAAQPATVLSLHPADPMPGSPRRWKLFTSSIRLDKDNPLAHLKTGNKLIQILARTEAEQNECDEALLLNTLGEVCETSSGNLFWIESNTLHTPPAESGLLPGVTRAVVMEIASHLGLTVVESRAQPTSLMSASGAFVTLSSQGIVEIVSVDGEALQRTTQTQSLHEAYLHQLSEETHGQA